MSTSLLENPPPGVITRLTVKEYRQLAEDGFFNPRDRTELIDGEIIFMSPIGRRHAAAVTRLTNKLAQVAQGRFDVSPQNPVELSEHSEPQPDLSLIRPEAVRGIDTMPETADAFLVIEVSDSTLYFDRGRKLRVYAEAGTLEVWIVNLRRNVIEVFRDADRAQGRFNQHQIFARGQTVAMLSFPDVSFMVEELLPLAPPEAH